MVYDIQDISYYFLINFFLQEDIMFRAVDSIILIIKKSSLIMIFAY